VVGVLGELSIDSPGAAPASPSMQVMAESQDAGAKPDVREDAPAP
jgi:hypothetical protein